MEVAVCVIVKDEAPYLLEWMSYHLLIGFDQVVVYDNGSRDTTGQVLGQASSKDHRIRFLNWPDVPGCSPQLAAYQDALRTIAADWIAFLDIDEFLVLKEARSIHGFLEGFASDVSAVSVNWMNFASSHHSEYEDRLVIERFVHRPPPDFYRNEVVKSIVRPGCVEAMTAHVPYLKEGRHCRADGSPYPTAGRNRASPARHYPAQINHYVIKSKEEYENKRRRGEAIAAPDDPRRHDKFGPDHWAIYDVNAESDDSLSHMIREVRRKMESISDGGLAGCGPPFAPAIEPPADASCGSQIPTRDHGGVEQGSSDQELRSRIVDCHHRFVEARLKFRLDEQRDRTEQERNSRRKESGRVAELELHAAGQERQIRSLRDEVERLEAALQTQSSDMRARALDRESVELQLCEMRESRSWRLTAPLRRCSYHLRRTGRLLARTLRPNRRAG